ncbi:MAG TPA: hypothetical protein VHC22_14785 [Pirellulales bacterium]|nr:hypothetical protein [Pirellulales bacterium]
MGLRVAAFVLGVLSGIAAVRAFGYRVVDLPPSSDTATVAREEVQKSRERHQSQLQKATERHRRAADWSKR